MAATLFSSFALLAVPSSAHAQKAQDPLPDNPAPPAAVAKDAHPPPASKTNPKPSSDTQPLAPQTAPATQQPRDSTAALQLKEEEKQRVLGVVPNFNITYLGENTVSLTAKQKFTLAAHSITDPVTFVTPFVVAGYHEAQNDQAGFPWGVKGLGERAVAAYLDIVSGTTLGDAILPSVLRQDPRYFRMGYGPVSHRTLYAISTNFRARHDKTGKWEPNYSNIGGNILSGALSNLYYPGSPSGIGLTVSNGLIATSETAVGSLFYEFWPDISRKVLHRDPTHGHDADAAAHRAAAEESKK